MKTNLPVTIMNIGEAHGSVGWLAKHATGIKTGVTKEGKRAAWLQLEGGKSICLVLHDPYNVSDYDHRCDSLEILSRYFEGMSPLSLDFTVTDACWESIKELAEKTKEIMEEQAENEESISFALDCVA